MLKPKGNYLALCTLFALLFTHGLTNEDQEAGIPEGTTVISEIIDEVVYATPQPIGNTYFVEHFDDEEAFQKKWIVSRAKKDGADETIAKYDGVWELKPAESDALKGDMGLALMSKAKHHAISAKLKQPFIFESRPFIVQYEVNFQTGQECGGAYLKLLTREDKMDLKQFTDKTPYTIMFGPDKCGNDHKLHFIFRHKNPLNGTFQEKHCRKGEAKLEEYFKDKQSHLYTLIIKPDSSYIIMVDQVVINSGSLLEDFDPAVNPLKEIHDPEDKKPEDWDERPKIPDPEAVKPDDWDEDAPPKIIDASAVKPENWQDDEEENIPDPNAQRPTDWDDDMDGAWEPPLISNPKCEVHGCGVWKPPTIDNPAYKGKWNPPLITNPKYKGRWEPRRIPNPHYYEDSEPYKMSSIGAVGLELWSMSDQILFDNIIITDDRYVADHWAAETWKLKKQKADKENGSVFSRFLNFTNSHPWLWAVYIVAIGIPVVLIAVFCCSSSEDKVGASKKSDEVSPDDDVHEEKIDEVEGEEEEDETTEEQQGDGVQASQGSNQGSRRNSQDESVEEEEEDAEEKEETSDNAEAGDSNKSPRRRRPRKD